MTSCEFRCTRPPKFLTGIKGILTVLTACRAPPNVTILRMPSSEELLTHWALLGYARRRRAQGGVAPILKNGSIRHFVR